MTRTTRVPSALFAALLCGLAILPLPRTEAQDAPPLAERVAPEVLKPLDEQLAPLLCDRATSPCAIDAGADIPFHWIVATVDRARQAGFRQITFVVARPDDAAPRVPLAGEAPPLRAARSENGVENTSGTPAEIAIDILRDGSVQVGNGPRVAAESAGLRDRLRPLVKTSEAQGGAISDQQVWLRADAGVPWGAVQHVLATCAQLGLWRTSFVTGPATGDGVRLLPVPLPKDSKVCSGRCTKPHVQVPRVRLRVSAGQPHWEIGQDPWCPEFGPVIVVPEPMDFDTADEEK